jgi:carboxynorspermidine decarboxylase
MLAKSFENFDADRVPSPCFVVDECAIEANLRILADVQHRSGAKILAALKAFSMWSLAPLFKKYLSGVCASGLHEAYLGHECYGGELHVFSAAYKQQDLEELCNLADHLVFNSFSQFDRYYPAISQAQEKRPELSFGLRINPEHSEGDVELYDPCAPCSRLGIPADQFVDRNLDGIEGLHFHTLCEHGVDALERTLAVVEEKFARALRQVKWVNFGGGHHITKPDYDRDRLVQVIRDFAQKYQVQVYLEPGEALAIHSGILVSEVLDLSRNQKELAILDTSATCHMPDVLEMPYRPHVHLSSQPGDKLYDYRLGGMTCLAGDVIGDYSFDAPLRVGQRLMFDDMAHYTMVKTSTFNGIALPSIALWNSETDNLNVIKEFTYEDFKSRLS